MTMSEHPKKGFIAKCKHWAAIARRDVLALYLAARHPETPWYAKWLAAATAAYALSPIDLMPDFIPVLGYIDDLILVPIGMTICIQLIPDAVMAECRKKAETMEIPKSLIAAMVIITLWLAFAFWMVFSVI